VFDGKVPDVKLVFHCLDANEGHARKLWNVIAKISGLVLIVKYLIVTIVQKMVPKLDAVWNLMSASVSTVGRVKIAPNV
jgi:hypothetical protein